MKNLTDSESAEMDNNRLSWEEDGLKPIGIKRFDEIRFNNKYWTSFKNNEKIPELISDIESYVSKVNYKYNKKELHNILNKYIPFFKDDMPKIDADLYKHTWVYRNKNKIIHTLVGLYKNSKEINGSLLFILKDKDENTEKTEVADSLRNPELTSIFYLLILEILEKNK